MRRLCWLPAILMLSGCSWLASLYEPPAPGQKSIMQYIGDAVHDLPYGGIVEGIIALGGMAVGGSGVHHIHTRKKKAKPANHPPAAPPA